MIDLTPLDVRNKRSDFKRILRGYDPQEVDVFLEMVAERLEVLVRENIQLRERAGLLQQQVSSSTGRERAVQEALVTAQELRADIRAQAQREADLILQEAQAEGRRRVADMEHRIEVLNDSLVELERRRMRFLKSFRQLLERELDGVEVEEARAPLEERAIEMQLGGGRADEDEEALPDVEPGGLDTAPLDAPRLDTAPMEASGLDAPPLDGPGLDTPPLETSRLDIPPLDAPGLDTPPLEAPRVDTAPIDAPRLDMAPEAAPSLDPASVDAPRLDPEPVEAPRVDTEPEAPVDWDAPVHELAREHEAAEPEPEIPPERKDREGDLFSLPDLPYPRDTDDAGGR